MKRTEKVEAVEQLNRLFTESRHFILATFRGLSVNQASELRRRVDESGGQYRVIKNRLARRAAAGTPAEPLCAKFEGPCSLATHDNDPVVLAKTLSDFAKENPQIEVLAGVIEARDLVDPAGVKQLAGLPSLPEQRSQLLALILTPATTLVRLINTPGSQVARVLDARREALDGQGAQE